MSNLKYIFSDDHVINKNMVDGYFSTLGEMAGKILVTDEAQKDCSLAEGMDQMMNWALGAHNQGRKLIFIGNGGSSTIASHMAVDYTKNGGIRAMCYSDAAFLTCLGNDLGYENVYAKPVEMFAQEGDVLVAISSSGKSANITNAVNEARKAKCKVITMSGFGDDNPLRKMGDLNFYVPNTEYGYVEITHLVICHAVLDFACEFRK